MPTEMLNYDEPHEFFDKYHIDTTSAITDSYKAGAHKFSMDSHDGQSHVTTRTDKALFVSQQMKFMARRASEIKPHEPVLSPQDRANQSMLSGG